MSEGVTLEFDAADSFVRLDGSSGEVDLEFQERTTAEVDPSFPHGTLSNFSWGQGATPVTAAGEEATAYLSLTSATGEFDSSDQLTLSPTLSLRIIADDSSFDCSVSGLVPEYIGVLGPTLPMPPPEYHGVVSLVDSVSVPDFQESRTCSGSVASTLSGEFADITDGELDTSYHK